MNNHNHNLKQTFESCGFFTRTRLLRIEFKQNIV